MVSLLKSLVDFVKTQRSEFEYFEDLGIKLCGHNKYNYSSQRRVRSPRRFYYDGNAENTVLSPKDAYRTEVFLIVIDTLISTVEAYKDINQTFGFFDKLTILSTHEIEQAARNLARSYPRDLESSSESEFIQFASLVGSDSSAELQASSIT